MRNYKSATGDDVRDKVDKAIREEINRRNYIMTTEKPTIVSVLGAIPKPDSVKIRLIPDCSRPQHSNVNSYTATQRYSYMTVDKAVSLIKTNAYLAKIDLKSPNRHVPIPPSNYTATGLARRFRGIKLSYICMTVSFHLGPQKVQKFSIDRHKQSRKC